MQPAEAAQRSQDLFLLDVREPEEWDAGHIAGSHHIPMGELPRRLDEVPTDATVLAICRSGNRSGRVTAWLAEQGYEVRNLDGGLKAWHAENLALDSGEGDPGVVA